jgi:dTMP kinase
MKKSSARRAKGKPLFIAIEGGEGSGKSSLMAALRAELGDAVVVTREPGGSPYAELIRNAAIKDPLAKTAPAETTLCLMFAARFDHILNLVLPSLKSGATVITDRFDGSSYAYQVNGQSDGAFEKIFWDLRARLAVIPDLYIYIDVDPREGLRRVANRNQSLIAGYDHFDDREVDFHEKVRDGYMKFMKKVPHEIIDANRPFEEVKKDFIALIKEKLGMGKTFVADH